MPASDAAPSAAAALTLSSGSWMKGPAPFMRMQACTDLELIKSRLRARPRCSLEGHAKNKEEGNNMNVPVNPRSIDIPTEFQSCFDKQRAAYLATPEPSYDQRMADLKALARLLKDNM